MLDVRHGNPPISKLDAIVGDVRDASAFVFENARRLRIDPERLGVWGASAGGYLALLLAFTEHNAGGGSRFRAAATYYPAGYDFPQDVARSPELAEGLVALQIPDERLDALSLKHHVSNVAPPTLVVFGTDDFPFIVEPSETICRELEARSVAVRRVAMPGIGHEFVGPDGYCAERGAQARAEVAAWFDRHLR